MRVLIIDGYVDEPACLGVPPYMSPYPRYIAGALVEKGIQKEDITYRAIESRMHYPTHHSSHAPPPLCRLGAI